MGGAGIEEEYAASMTLHSYFEAQDEGILPSGRRGAARGKEVLVGVDWGSLEEAFPPSGCSNGSFISHLACMSTYSMLASGQVLHCMIPNVQSDPDLVWPLFCSQVLPDKL